MTIRKIVLSLFVLIINGNMVLAMEPGTKSNAPVLLINLDQNVTDDQTQSESDLSSPKSDDSTTPLTRKTKAKMKQAAAQMLIEKLKAARANAEPATIEENAKSTLTTLLALSLASDEPGTDTDDLEPIADKLSTATLGLHVLEGGKGLSPEERVSRWRNLQAGAETQEDLEAGPAEEKLPRPEARRRIQRAIQRWFNRRSKLARGALSFGGMCGLAAASSYFGYYQSGNELVLDATGFELGEAGAALTQQNKLNKRLGAFAVWTPGEVVITLTLIPALKDWGLTEAFAAFYAINTILYAKKNNLRNATDLTDTFCFLPRETQANSLKG